MSFNVAVEKNVDYLCKKKNKAKQEKNIFSVPVKTKQIIKNRDTTSKVNIPKVLPAKGVGQ